MKIYEIKDSIISIESKDSYFLNQIVEFDKGQLGIIVKTTKDKSYVIVDDSSEITTTSKYKVQSKEWTVSASNDELGKIIDVFGKQLFSIAKSKSKLKAEQKYSAKIIDSKAPSFSLRMPLNEPLKTGLFSTDVLIPIGKGQRELIIGDRKTGKTSIALSTIINQKGKGVKVIYVSIGQKQTSLSNVFKTLAEHGAMEYTTIISAQSDLKLSQYIAPYVAMAKAESFAEKNEDVLVVWDDLSKHANIYREISLNLNRSGGRDAYPADLFYLHSRLLERAGKFSKEIGGGTITALPIIETVEGDFATLLATNVISITDGQIMTDSHLAKQNIFPAINVGLSVSRTGSAVQTKQVKAISKSISKIYTQYIDAKKYEMISMEISNEVKEKILRGETLLKAFEQNGYVGMQDTAMFIYAKIIESSAILNMNKSIKGFFTDNLNDKTLRGILEQISEDDSNAIELLEIYFKQLDGEINKYNAKRVKGVKYE